MSVAATTIWAFSVASEVRNIAKFVLCTLTIPRCAHTEFSAEGQQISMTGISTRRLCMGLLMAIIRFTIAVILLISGSVFLVHTTDVSDLILNSTALAFVLDIDELFFSMGVPTSMQSFIQTLQPLAMRRKVAEQFAPLLFFLALLYIIVIDITLLRPFVHTMQDILVIIKQLVV